MSFTRSKGEVTLFTVSKQFQQKLKEKKKKIKTKSINNGTEDQEKDFKKQVQQKINQEYLESMINKKQFQSDESSKQKKEFMIQKSTKKYKRKLSQSQQNEEIFERIKNLRNKIEKRFRENALTKNNERKKKNLNRDLCIIESQSSNYLDLQCQSYDKKFCEQLSKQMQNLFKLIHEKTMFDNFLKEIGFNIEKYSPVKIFQVLNFNLCYQTLKQIYCQIKNLPKNQEKIKKLSKKYIQVLFLQIIDKKNFQLIDSQHKIKSKFKMLKDIKEINFFFDTQPNHIYSFANKLFLLDSCSQNYHILTKYFYNTIRSQNNIILEDIYEIKNSSQGAKSQANKHLLWYGTSLTSVYSILKKGLTLPTKYLPNEFYFFGRGYYFTDMACEAILQTRLSRRHPKGCLFLFEVNLGQIKERFYSDRISTQFDSLKGVGRIAPDEGQFIENVYIPCGMPKSTGISNTSLEYNQYFINDKSKLKCRYLITIFLKNSVIM